MKICARCEIEKEFVEFSKNRNTKDGYSCYCKQCETERSKKYNLNNREKISESKRNYYLNNKERYAERQIKYRLNNREKIADVRRIYTYNLNTEQYDQMLSTQEYECAICFDGLDLGKHTHIDHCHSSNKIRGVLCSSCNHMLGFSKDNITTLQSAITYLEKHQEKEDANTS